MQLCSEPRGPRGIVPETFREGVIVYLVLRPLDPHVLTSLIPLCVVCIVDVQVHGQAGFEDRREDITAESRDIPKDAFVRWAMTLLSVTLTM